MVKMASSTAVLALTTRLITRTQKVDGINQVQTIRQLDRVSPNAEHSTTYYILSEATTLSVRSTVSPVVSSATVTTHSVLPTISSPRLESTASTNSISSAIIQVSGEPAGVTPTVKAVKTSDSTTASLQSNNPTPSTLSSHTQESGPSTVSPTISTPISSSISEEVALLGFRGIDSTLMDHKWSPLNSGAAAALVVGFLFVTGAVAWLVWFLARYHRRVSMMRQHYEKRLKRELENVCERAELDGREKERQSATWELGGGPRSPVELP
ncbi:hypothetical protein F5Y15DRAFT_101717 [Xylariaceae sp. FL0016]|nr:hypothetical protein F5Y15DRAFT_101717 [Xylariaceae sp. FL0016]